MDLTLSVVLATYERRELVVEAVASLFRQDLAPEEYEIVVVVDGSSDGSAEALRACRGPCALRVIEQPNRGRSLARNAGLGAARGRLVLFLDDDIVSEPGLLRAHVDAHGTADGIAALGPVLVAAESPASAATDAARTWLEVLSSRADGRTDVPLREVRVGPNTSASRAALLAAGGFDPLLTRFHEDTDLGMKLLRAGVRFRFLPHAVASQVYDKSAEAVVRGDAVALGDNQPIVCRRYPELRPHSALALLGDGHLGKVWARRLALELPFSVEPLVRPAFAATERLRSIPSFRAASRRLLAARRAIVQYRAAARRAGGVRELEAEFGVRLPVLLYHHVGPRRSGATNPAFTVTPRRFRREMMWLRDHGYRTIRAADWEGWRVKGTPLPRRPVLITFDDAYADIARHALPVMEELGLVATIFVVTRRLGASNDWDSTRGLEERRLMPAEELQDWSRRGFELGAHGRTHIDLTRAPAAVLEDEVAGSASDLRALCPANTPLFAYPFGRLDERVERAVAKHFALAFTLGAGPNTLATPPHRLRRTMVGPRDSAVEFGLRVKLGWNPIDGLRRRLRLGREDGRGSAPM